MKKQCNTMVSHVNVLLSDGDHFKMTASLTKVINQLHMYENESLFQFTDYCLSALLM